MVRKSKKAATATVDDGKITVERLTDEQKAAVRAMQAGNNVHLYGKAGTGKSVTLRAYLDSIHDGHTIICAPTGIAAINVGGATIHSTFKAPTDPIGPTEAADVGIPDVFAAVHRVVIDEISMCRFDLFGYVAAVIRAAEIKYNRDIQLIVCGDFLQLPPVMREDDDPRKDQKKILQMLWGDLDFEDGFAFTSPKWAGFGFVNAGLNQIMRQTGDDEFVANINKARVGDRSCLPFFNSLVGPKPERAIILTGTNNDARERNQAEVEKLPETYNYRAHIDDPRHELKPSDYPVPELLTLGVGARVISVKNGKGYQNGSLGTIVKADELSRYVTVAFDNGVTAEIEPEEWDFTKYEVVPAENGKKELEKVTYATFTQLPLKLGYAITIHKSQGQTYDSAYIYPKAFAKGQEYVALSRCRTRQGLVLAKPIKPKYLIAGYSALQFYHKIDPANYGDPDEILKPMTVEENQTLSDEQRAQEAGKAPKAEKAEKKSAKAEKKPRDNASQSHYFDPIGYKRPLDNNATESMQNTTKNNTKQEETKMEFDRNATQEAQEQYEEQQQDEKTEKAGRDGKYSFSARLEKDVKQRLSKFLDDLKREFGLDVSGGMERIIDVFEKEKVKVENPDRALEIDTVNGHLKAVSDSFINSVKLCKSSDDRVRQFYVGEIEEQKNALVAADEQIKNLTQRAAEAEAKVEIAEKDSRTAIEKAEAQVREMQLTLDNAQNVIDKYKAESVAAKAEFDKQVAEFEKQIAEVKSEAAQEVAKAHDNARDTVAASKEEIAKLKGKIEVLQEVVDKQENSKKAKKS